MNWKLITLLSIIFSSCQLTPPISDKIPVIIDADTANELDDLFAIIRALIDDRIEVKALTAAQFNISPYASDTTAHESQALNERILDLLRSDVPSYVGSDEPLTDTTTIRSTPATTAIINCARDQPLGQKLEVIILGSCTNVASAILLAPDIVSRIRVSYIGFWHDTESNIYDKNEFNTGNDPLATDILLDYPELEFEVMTASTCQHLVFDKEEAYKHLPDAHPLSQLLLQRWENFKRHWTDEDLENKHWIMWDVAIIEALIHPEWAVKESFLTPADNNQRYIKCYTNIEVESMKNDCWQTIQNYLSQ